MLGSLGTEIPDAENKRSLLAIHWRLETAGVVGLLRNHPPPVQSPQLLRILHSELQRKRSAGNAETNEQWSGLHAEHASEST
jgi:hypothetical protein